MANGTDPISSMMNNLATSLNAIAPHTVLPKMFPGLGTNPLASGGTPAAITERRATREGVAPEVLTQKVNTNKEKSEKAGFSATGQTIIF